MAQRQEAKTLQDIIKSVNFEVMDVVCESVQGSFTPTSEMIMGGRSSSYNTGYSSVLKLRVTPSNPSNPVRELLFYGYSPVKGGDLIDVKIPAYEGKLSNTFLLRSMQRVPIKFDYSPRELKETENAIEIAILSAGWRGTLRVDRSVDYHNYIRE